MDISKRPGHIILLIISQLLLMDSPVQAQIPGFTVGFEGFVKDSISTPSAREDTEGMDIISPTLKCEKEKNNHTTLELNIGDCNLYGGLMGYSRQLGNVQFSLHSGATHKLENQIKEHFRENYGTPLASDYSQYDTQDIRHNNGFVNAQLNYKINKTNSFSASAAWSKAMNIGDRAITYRTVGKNGVVEQESEKTIDIRADHNAYDGDFNYLLDFGKPGQKIKIITGFSGSTQTQDMENSHYYDLYPRLQNTRSFISDRKAKGMVEYTHPLNSTIFLHGGFSYNSQDFRNLFSSKSYDYASPEWTPDEELSNMFLHIQHINALFLEMNGSTNSWKGRLGLRAEHTLSIQNSKERKSTLSLFPSFSLFREMEEKHTFFVMYSRKINRPAMNMLNPFPDNYADELNIYQGNPALKPEFIHSFETGYRFFHPQWSGTASVFHRHLGEAISQIKRELNDSVLMMTYVNLHKASLTGCDLNGMLMPFTWWKISFSTLFFKTSLYEKSANSTIVRSRWAWQGNFTTLFRFPLEFEGQLAGYYQSKLPSVMGTYLSRYYVDVTISKNVMKGQGQLVFKISDVFDSYLYGLDLYATEDKGMGYRQSNRRKINSECFTLSLTYNINKKNQSLKTAKERFFLDNFEN